MHLRHCLKGGDKYDELGISGNDGRSRNFRIAFWIRCSCRFNFVGRLALEANSEIIFDLPLDKLLSHVINLAKLAKII